MHSISNLSNNALMWLRGMLTGGIERSNPDEKIKDEYNNFIPKNKITLYRGLDKKIIDYYEDRLPSSWTYDKNIALYFGRYVYVATFSTSDVVFDTTMVIPDEIIVYCGGFPEEKEVIIKPGTYPIINQNTNEHNEHINQNTDEYVLYASDHINHIF